MTNFIYMSILFLHEHMHVCTNTHAYLTLLFSGRQQMESYSFESHSCGACRTQPAIDHRDQKVNWEKLRMFSASVIILDFLLACLCSFPESVIVFLLRNYQLLYMESQLCWPFLVTA